jgi:hypothetical protein
MHDISAMSQNDHELPVVSHDLNGCFRIASLITDRASAATDSADRQRCATEPRRQNATNFRNAQLSVVSCKPLLDGARTTPQRSSRNRRA